MTAHCNVMYIQSRSAKEEETGRDRTGRGVPQCAGNPSSDWLVRLYSNINFNLNFAHLSSTLHIQALLAHVVNALSYLMNASLRLPLECPSISSGPSTSG